MWTYVISSFVEKEIQMGGGDRALVEAPRYPKCTVLAGEKEEAFFFFFFFFFFLLLLLKKQLIRFIDWAAADVVLVCVCLRVWKVRTHALAYVHKEGIFKEEIDFFLLLPPPSNPPSQWLPDLLLANTRMHH